MLRKSTTLMYDINGRLVLESDSTELDLSNLGLVIMFLKL